MNEVWIFLSATLFVGLAVGLPFLLGNLYCKKYNQELGMAWWYANGILWTIVPLVYACINPGFMVLLVLGLLITFAQSRWAFLMATIFSSNPIVWLVNGIYLKNRWALLKEHHGNDWLGKGYGLLLCILAIAVLIAVIITQGSIPTSKAQAGSGNLNFSAVGDATAAPVRVKRNLYSVTPEADWRSIQKAEADYDLEFTVGSQNAIFCIISEEGMAEPQAYVNTVISNFRARFPNAQFTPLTYCTISGKNNWLHTTSDVISEGTYVTGDFYLYTGQEGSFQLVGFYPTNRREFYSRKINRVVDTFLFNVAPTNGQ